MTIELAAKNLSTPIFTVQLYTHLGAQGAVVDIETLMTF
jgi:hypothetical protein